MEVIDKIDFTKCNGVIIKTANFHTALIASQYIIRKYEQDNKTIYDFVELNDCELEVYENSRQIKLPIIEARYHFDSPYDFSSYEFPAIPKLFDDEPSYNNETTSLSSYKDYEFPIIIHETNQPFLNQINQLKEEKRFIIYIIENNLINNPFLNNDVNEFINNLIFETNYEYINIKEPDINYYQAFLSQIINENGYELDNNINTSDIISNLIKFRQNLFTGLEDINTLVLKTIKKKGNNSLILTNNDFNIFTDTSINKENTENPFAVLNSMIGLQNVKEQIRRLVCQLKYESQRRLNNLPTSITHMALVFMGSPGTAKTTVARLLGKILCYEGILKNNSFYEVSKKDLVGKYVGWTGKIVTEIFEKAKGGTLFIDEAYSLLDNDRSDSFSEEAIAEIIRQMENNPDTLVIFAGYTEEMINFVEKANTGLRSRITAIIEFKDYNIQEMFDIFTYMLKQENYHIDDYEKAKNIITNFLNEMSKLKSKNLGNGRLMRKLYKTSIEYKSINNASDFKTLHVPDIELATKALLNNEKLLNKTNELNKSIGFLK